MTIQESRSTNGHNSYPFSWRDLVAIGFRHKRPVLITFCAILFGAVLAAVIAPAEYRTTTKFLIEHQRVDPIVSPNKDTGVIRVDVPEEELNSEVELLQSQDVLQKVVLASGLHQRRTMLSYVGVRASEAKRVAKAVDLLRKELQIAVVRKSDLISVSYTANDPQLAVRVLQALDEAYVQKNLAVHHPPGEFQFFDQETENYKKNLALAEAQLKDFSQQEGGVSPQLARDITLQKLNDFTASLQQTYADIAGTERRIDALEKQSGTTPQRLTTQLRAVDDVQVLQGLKTTLITLELKRTELLTKYQPTYPLVQEVDKEIADTLASIAREEGKPVRDETTDRNPTYAWINEELAKAKADDSGLQARAAAIQATVARYQGKAHDLEQKGILQQSLLRKVKTEEENYLLYQHKREEAMRWTASGSLTWPSRRFPRSLRCPRILHGQCCFWGRFWLPASASGWLSPWSIRILLCGPRRKSFQNSIFPSWLRFPGIEWFPATATDIETDMVQRTAMVRRTETVRRTARAMGTQRLRSMTRR
jgi:uncharacterized protein involved in exopolysaccharide biosynthesis